jgi:NADH-quinone oxidoreductase subunit L
MMVNKVGDMAVLLGISVSFLVYGSADFSIMFMLTPFLLKSTCAMGSYTLSSITLFTWLIFVGAVGKSAQIGLHT